MNPQGEGGGFFMTIYSGDYFVVTFKLDAIKRGALERQTSREESLLSTCHAQTGPWS